MTQLHNLSSNNKDRKNIGRGGSRGGTSGRGHKGQRARTSGNAPAGFEGGQMPLYRRLPKRGFTNARFDAEVVAVGLERIAKAFNEGEMVTRESLIERGVIKRHKGKKAFAIKILGGDFTKKLIIEAEAFSQSAKQAIEQAGGEVKLTKES